MSFVEEVEQVIMNNNHPTPIASSSNEAGPSVPVFMPLILGGKGSIAALVNSLLQSSFYSFQSPASVDGKNQFIFSIPGIADKTFLNPGFANTKLYRECKEKVLSVKLPEKFAFSVTTKSPLIVIPPEEFEQIELDAMLAYCFHRNISAHLLSGEATSLLCDLKTIPQIDILDFFEVPKVTPDEKLPLDAQRLHSILEEKFFQFRKPARRDNNYVFVHMRSGLFVQLLRYHEKNGDSTTSLFKGENVVTYKGEMYSCLSLEDFADHFLIPFCMDFGVRWEVNNADFI